MEPGQHVDGFGEGNGTKGSDVKSSPSIFGLSSFDIILLEPRFTSDVWLAMYAFAISIGEDPVSSRSCNVS